MHADTRPFPAAARDGEIRPNCDIGRAGSGRVLADPSADLGTLSARGEQWIALNAVRDTIGAGSSPPVRRQFGGKSPGAIAAAHYRAPTFRRGSRGGGPS
jgi:hypothetical protein